MNLSWIPPFATNLTVWDWFILLVLLWLFGRRGR
jgi:hypothetical protein